MQCSKQEKGPGSTVKMMSTVQEKKKLCKEEKPEEEQEREERDLCKGLSASVRSTALRASSLLRSLRPSAATRCGTSPLRRRELQSARQQSTAAPDSHWDLLVHSDQSQQPNNYFSEAL